MKLLYSSSSFVNKFGIGSDIIVKISYLMLSYLHVKQVTLEIYVPSVKSLIFEEFGPDG